MYVKDAGKGKPRAVQDSEQNNLANVKGSSREKQKGSSTHRVKL